MNYSEIVNKNRRLEKELSGAPPFRIKVLANFTADQIKDILEYRLRKEGIPAIVELSAYDNIVQESMGDIEADEVIVFWELGRISENFHINSETMPESVLEELLEKTRTDTSLVINNLSSTKNVVIMKFSAAPYSEAKADKTLKKFASDLNQRIESLAFENTNVTVVDTNLLLEKTGLKKAWSSRNAKIASAPFTVAFWKELSEFIAPVFIPGQLKKVIVFDADNTLWRGIIGEDGIDGINISEPFAEVQLMAKELLNKGILLALCSKNNKDDVMEVLESRKEMILRAEDFSAMRINWDDKPGNLKKIAEDLNLGLDSFVFIDDSPIECGLVQSQLPMVTVLQVPDQLKLYPATIQSIAHLFGNSKQTKEDMLRAESYRTEKIRKEQQNLFSSVDEYLASLGLELTIDCDNPSHIERAAQLCQRTNQFNMTTIRFSEEDIESMISDPAFTILTASVCDRFGDYGITGLLILKLDQEGNEAMIEVFLLSCRVLGRGIEKALLFSALNRLDKKGLKSCNARYSPTNKNTAFENFYKETGFTLDKSDENNKYYSINLKNSLFECPSYVKTIWRDNSTYD